MDQIVKPLKCPMDALLRLLMGPWTTYVLWVVTENGPIRFGEIKRRIPSISSRVLTDRLRRLERAGVVHREQKPTIPPQVSYELTARGRELRTALKDLEDVAMRWKLA